MAYSPRVIAPVGQSLNKYFKPWLTPEDSFQVMNDVYVRRGVINKRNGFALLARLPSLNTSASLDVSTMTAASPMVITTSANHGLTTGQRIWIDSAAGTGGGTNTNYAALNDSWYEVTVTGATTFTMIGAQPTDNVSRNDWPIQTINGTGFGTYSANTAQIYLSIVGLSTYTVINGPDVLIAFDQVNAFEFNPSSSTWTITTDSSGGNPVETWTGRNWEYFQTYNYYKKLWATNWHDNIKYWDGAHWTVFTRTYDGTHSVTRARVVVAYKNRLIFLNTTENSVNFPNRARWSWAGDPTDVAAFREDFNNGSGWADADTDEDIVGVEFNRDQMIVFFENSVWTLTYTSNDILPFVWQRINVQYGSVSTNAVVSLDQNIVTVSSRGIIASNSTDVARIDLQIPEQVFEIETSLVDSSGTSASNARRVSAVQNYDLQQVIWPYPNEQPSSSTALRQHVRNDRALVYNYQEQTWSIYRVNWTVMTNFRTIDEKTWGNTSTTWGDASWTWGTSFASVDKIILLAGSDSGRIFEISDVYSQEIDDTGATVSFGFEVQTKRYNAFIELGQRCRVEFIDLYLDGNSGSQFDVSVTVDDNINAPIVLRTVDASSTTDTVKRVYVGAYGRNIQFKLLLSDEQIQGTPGQSPFGLQAIIVWTAAAGRLVL